MSKHIKLPRSPKEYKGNWADGYGHELWYDKYPEYAMSQWALQKLADALIKDRNLHVKLYAVDAAGRIQVWDCNLSVAHFLNSLSIVFFDNYWHAHAFSLKAKEASDKFWGHHD